MLPDRIAASASTYCTLRVRARCAGTSPAKATTTSALPTANPPVEPSPAHTPSKAHAAKGTSRKSWRGAPTLDGREFSELFKLAVPDTGYIEEVVNAGEGSVGFAPLDDGFG